MGTFKIVFPTHIAEKYERNGGFSTSVITNAGGWITRNANWTKHLDRWELPHKIDKSEYDALDALHKLTKGQAHNFLFLDRLDYQGSNEWLGIGDASETDFQIRKHYSSTRMDDAIVAADAVNDTFSVTDDRTWRINAGDFIEVTGSTGGDDDGWYIVSSLTYSAPNTVITVTGSVPSGHGDGTIYTCYNKQINWPADESRYGVAIGVTAQVREAGVWVTKTEGAGDDYTVDYETGIITFNAGHIPGATDQVRASEFEFYKLVRFGSDSVTTIAYDDNYVTVEMPIIEVRE